MERQQWILEDGKGVNLANRKMDCEGSGWDQPAAVSRGSYRVGHGRERPGPLKTSGVIGRTTSHKR